MDSSNRLASFLDSIEIKSDVEKKVKDFPHSTAVAFFQELESNTTDNNEKKYIVELLICKAELRSFARAMGAAPPSPGQMDVSGHRGGAGLLRGEGISGYPLIPLVEIPCT